MDDLKYLGSKSGDFIGDNNDLVINELGDLVIVNGVDRLKQDIVKILLTPYTLQPYPNYGSLLPSLKGISVTDTSLTSRVTDDIITSLRYLDLGETSEVESERISEITTLTAEYALSTLNITLTILARNSEQFNFSFEV